MLGDTLSSDACVGKPSTFGSGFDVHVTADEDHGDAIVETLIQHATTEELQRAVRDAAWNYAEYYHGMLSTYESYT